MEKAQEAGIIYPEILIPEAKINSKKWAVVACDQYTSDEEYWGRVARTVGGAPSTLHIIVPEAFLRESDVEDRIMHAKETMSHYIEDGVLVRLPKGVVVVERETQAGTRVGIMMAVDLEKYDSDFSAKPLIRATEQTVADRVPPRMRLREGALLECPHVLLLIDDVKNSVIGPVYNSRSNAARIYDTQLMMEGGRVSGWFIDDDDVLSGMTEALLKLKSKAKDGMLFAVGDGNHSLASAKAVWDVKKESLTEEQKETHPLRYALVEVVNIYDNGLTMEPIHRVLFGVEPTTALRTLVSILNSMGAEARMMYTRGTRTPVKAGTQIVYFESKMSKGRIEIMKPQHDLIAVTLTKALDKLMKEMPKAEIDYIHGEEEFHELATEHNSLGFYMETVSKENLFEAVAEYGVLPRKFFSLGRSDEKRYYYECRLLVEAKGASQEEEPDESAQPETTEAAESPVMTEEIHEQEEQAAAQEPEAEEPGAEPEYQQPGEYEDGDDDDFFGEGRPAKKRKGLFGRKRER